MPLMLTSTPTASACSRSQVSAWSHDRHRARLAAVQSSTAPHLRRRSTSTGSLDVAHCRRTAAAAHLRGAGGRGTTPGELAGVDHVEQVCRHDRHQHRRGDRRSCGSPGSALSRPAARRGRGTRRACASDGRSPRAASASVRSHRRARPRSAGTALPGLVVDARPRAGPLEHARRTSTRTLTDRHLLDAPPTAAPCRPYPGGVTVSHAVLLDRRAALGAAARSARIRSSSTDAGSSVGSCGQAAPRTRPSARTAACRRPGNAGVDRSLAGVEERELPVRLDRRFVWSSSSGGER